MQLRWWTRCATIGIPKNGLATKLIRCKYSGDLIWEAIMRIQYLAVWMLLLTSSTPSFAESSSTSQTTSTSETTTRFSDPTIELTCPDKSTCNVKCEGIVKSDSSFDATSKIRLFPI